jgi:hypothetical protein
VLYAIAILPRSINVRRYCLYRALSCFRSPFRRIASILSLIYLKGSSPLRTNRDSARKRKPGVPFAGLIPSNDFAGKKTLYGRNRQRSIRGNTVSLSDRKAALVGGLVASGSCDRRKAPTSVVVHSSTYCALFGIDEAGTGPKNAFVNAQVIAGAHTRGNGNGRNWSGISA